MKIDLHVHSKEYSFCGRSSLEEQVEAAISAGLDALVFSNHNQFVPEAHLQAINAKYAPFQVFHGIELDVDDEHILVVGLHHPALERKSWTYAALHQFMQHQHGLLVLAHPFRYADDLGIDLERFPPDALEAYSTNISSHLEQRICGVARELGLPVVSNSDAHHTMNVGRHYNILAETPDNEAGLVELLKAGQFSCVAPAAFVSRD